MCSFVALRCEIYWGPDYYMGVNIYRVFFVSGTFLLPSIISALLEDSKQVSFQRGFARYFLAILSTCATSQSNVRFKVILSTCAKSQSNVWVFKKWRQMNKGEIPLLIFCPYAGWGLYIIKRDELVSKYDY